MSDDLEFQHKQPKKLNYKEKVKQGLIKGGLKSVSIKRQDWLDKYNEQAEKDDVDQCCIVCGKWDTKYNMERHHPNGRTTLINLLNYKWVHPKCHRKIHTNKLEAKKNGWIN